MPRSPDRSPETSRFLRTLPSAPGVANEDAVAADRTVAVLLDGAGIPARYRAGCRHSVAWFSHALARHLLDALTDQATPMRAALAAAITEVRSQHETGCDLEAGSPSATVVAVRRTSDALEHLVLSDSSLYLTAPGGQVTRRTDARLDDVRERAGSAEEIEALRNHPGCFWVARYEPEAADHALVGCTPLADLQCISLVSDGVTRAVDMLGLLDDAGLATACSTPDGTAELLATIRATEQERRAHGTLPARKTHDDATVLTWTLAT
ncbi:MAG: protein phosphatase 2C domain-containing protein [Brachybacterium sp.]|nr:protein phosphatase 2C domain-containing protein [Brachybacterium sp.]